MLSLFLMPTVLASPFGRQYHAPICVASPLHGRLRRQRCRYRWIFYGRHISTPAVPPVLHFQRLGRESCPFVVGLPNFVEPATKQPPLTCVYLPPRPTVRNSKTCHHNTLPPPRVANANVDYLSRAPDPCVFFCRAWRTWYGGNRGALLSLFYLLPRSETSHTPFGSGSSPRRRLRKYDELHIIVLGSSTTLTQIVSENCGPPPACAVPSKPFALAAAKCLFATASLLTTGPYCRTRWTFPAQTPRFIASRFSSAKWLSSTYLRTSRCTHRRLFKDESTPTSTVCPFCLMQPWILHTNYPPSVALAPRLLC